MAYTNEFEEFWQLYPGRTNKLGRIRKQDKLGAFVEWNKMTGRERKLAMTGHPVQDSYTCDARKWLKHKRWEDEDITDAITEHVAERKRMELKQKQRDSAGPWIIGQDEQTLREFIERRPGYEWLVRELRPEILNA